MTSLEEHENMTPGCSNHSQSRSSLENKISLYNNISGNYQLTYRFAQSTYLLKARQVKMQV